MPAANDTQPVCRPTFTMANLGDRQLRCAIWNRDTQNAAPPLLLFNGIGMNLETLQPLAEALSGALDHRTILSVEPPGIGRSLPPFLPYSPAMMAGWAMEWLRQLGYSVVDVFGFSWGGAIAQEFALHHTSHVHHLALASIGTGWPVMQGSVAALFNMADPDWLTALIQDPRRMVFYGLGPSDRAVLTPEFLSRIETNCALGQFYQMMALAGWSSVARLPALATPTLIMMGAHDPVIPFAEGRRLADLLPNAHSEILADAGHLLIFSHMAQCVQALRHFLSCDRQAANFVA